MTNLEIFRKAGVIEILLYLFENKEGKRKVDIRIDLKLSSTTAVKAHNILLESHLIEKKLFSSENLFILSEFGLEIASLLVKIKNIKYIKKKKTYILHNEEGTHYIEMGGKKIKVDVKPAENNHTVYSFKEVDE